MDQVLINEMNDCKISFSNFDWEKKLPRVVIVYVIEKFVDTNHSDSVRRI